MPSHLGFSASIESNGVLLPEYLVSVEEDPSRVSCWIPGVAGQTFTVRWTDAGSNVITCAYIFLDGGPASGRFLYGAGSAARSGVRVRDSTTELPFMFKKLKKKDLKARRDSKDAGLIILKIKKVKCLQCRAPNPIQSVPAVGALGLRKKGDLCVGFGKERKVDPQYCATWDVTSFEADKPGVKPRTYVSFAFRYRSPEFLEAQGIASIRQPLPAFALTHLAKRTVSLSMPPPGPQHTSDPVTASGPSSVNTPPIGVDSQWLPPTPVSSGSGDSPPVLAGAPTGTNPSDSERRQSLGKWRPYDPGTAHPRRAPSWKVAHTVNNNVDIGAPQTFQSAFMVAPEPHSQSPHTLDPR